jgi:hypothetical protein
MFGHAKNAFNDAQERYGKFRAAERGTLFLDEIADLPSHRQASILIAVEDKEITVTGTDTTCPVDVRILSATNRDLEAAIAQGRFREDLLHRLRADMPSTLFLPPLRECLENLDRLARKYTDFFAEKADVSVGIADEAISAMRDYEWPGNVRELRAFIQCAVAVKGDGEVIRVEDLPDHIRIPAARSGAAIAVPAPVALKTITALDARYNEDQRRLILDALSETTWRVEGKKGAAALLGIKPGTLRARMKKLGIRRGTATAASDSKAQPKAVKAVAKASKTKPAKAAAKAAKTKPAKAAGESAKTTRAKTKAQEQRAAAKPAREKAAPAQKARAKGTDKTAAKPHVSAAPNGKKPAQSRKAAAQAQAQAKAKTKAKAQQPAGKAKSSAPQKPTRREKSRKLQKIAG